MRRACQNAGQTSEPVEATTPPTQKVELEGLIRKRCLKSQYCVERPRREACSGSPSMCKKSSGVTERPCLGRSTLAPRQSKPERDVYRATPRPETVKRHLRRSLAQSRRAARPFSVWQSSARFSSREDRKTPRLANVRARPQAVFARCPVASSNSLPPLSNARRRQRQGFGARSCDHELPALPRLHD